MTDPMNEIAEAIADLDENISVHKKSMHDMSNEEINDIMKSIITDSIAMIEKISENATNDRHLKQTSASKYLCAAHANVISLARLVLYFVEERSKS